MDELEIMRQQLDALKQQISKQQIVNEKLMRNVMKRKSSWLNILVNAEIVIIPLFTFVLLWSCSFFGISDWFAWTYFLLAVIDVVYDWKYVRIPPQMFGSASLVEFARFLIKQKRTRFLQTAIMLPLSIVWLMSYSYAAFVYGKLEFFVDHPREALITGICTGIIGSIAGIIAVIILYRKMQSTNDALLRDLEAM